MNIDLKKILSLCRALLLAFALISIGYMLGKNSVREQSASLEIAGNADHVTVYYLHSTFRCETCNRIEAMTKELLEREYAALIANGHMRWAEIDFMKNTQLAKRFEIAASTVVVADIREGEVLRYQRLDKVWTLTGDRKAFESYLRTAIDLYLDGKDAK
ncbi:MAG: nitrophenyl compound nitroreductase subunit ArsF family protein [bacterium]|jgi:hypothetical protein|nr:nitrophenyl compound nitroreductase subunit ArsF family protein [bacterium]